MVFFQYFLIIFICLVLQWSNKNPRNFFSLKEVEKSKNVYINYFFQILELNSIRKVSFNPLVPLFLVNYTVIRCIRLKTEKPLNNKFSLKIRPELKSANFLSTMLRIVCDSVIQYLQNFRI